MGYPKDIKDYTTEELKREIAARDEEEVRKLSILTAEIAKRQKKRELFRSLLNQHGLRMIDVLAPEHTSQADMLAMRAHLRLDADGPIQKCTDKAFYNGFVDMLAGSRTLDPIGSKHHGHLPLCLRCALLQASADWDVVSEEILGDFTFDLVIGNITPDEEEASTPTRSIYQRKRVAKPMTGKEVVKSMMGPTTDARPLTPKESADADYDSRPGYGRNG